MKSGKGNPLYVGVKAPPGKLVKVTCDDVADPYFISKVELKHNHKYYFNDPTIHVEILEKEDGDELLQDPKLDPYMQHQRDLQFVIQGEESCQNQNP